jgi:hypothetical protein
MYRIIGGDQKEYGPVSAEEVRRWIVEGRLYANNLVRVEGATEWKPLSSFPEFAGGMPAGASSINTHSTLPVQQSNSMAVLGLVLSCFSLICCVGCAPAGILGIVFSSIGLTQANRDPAHSGKGLAIAGIVIGIISLLGTVLALSLGLFGRLFEEISKH